MFSCSSAAGSWFHFQGCSMLPSSQLVLHYDEQHAPHKSLALLCTCPLCPSSTPTLRPALPGHPICLRWPLQLLCQGQLLLLFCSAKHAHVKTKVFFSTTNCTQDVVEQKTVHSNGSGSGGADFTCSCGAVLTHHSIPTFSFAKHSHFASGSERSGAPSRDNSLSSFRAWIAAIRRA